MFSVIILFLDLAVLLLDVNFDQLDLNSTISIFSAQSGFFVRWPTILENFSPQPPHFIFPCSISSNLTFPFTNKKSSSFGFSFIFFGVSRQKFLSSSLRLASSTFCCGAYSLVLSSLPLNIFSILLEHSDTLTELIFSYTSM